FGRDRLLYLSAFSPNAAPNAERLFQPNTSSSSSFQSPSVALIVGVTASGDAANRLSVARAEQFGLRHARLPLADRCRSGGRRRLVTGLPDLPIGPLTKLLLRLADTGGAWAVASREVPDRYLDNEGAEADADADSVDGPLPGMAFRSLYGMRLEHSSTRADIDKCLAEDPSIFEYDSIYDQITERKPERQTVKTVSDRAPKYIGGLMQAAGERKMEREYQKEKKIQAEREAEGELYADKEAFVTSAYKKKLAEFSELERQHKLQEAKDARQAAAKQQDLTGFYRNLLDRGRKPQSEEPPPPQLPQSSSSSSAAVRDRDRDRRQPHRHQHRRSRRSRSRSSSASSSGGAAKSAKASAGSAGPVLDPLLLVKLRRRNNQDAVSSARERYLQRKGLTAAAPPISNLAMSTSKSKAAKQADERWSWTESVEPGDIAEHQLMKAYNLLSDTCPLGACRGNCRQNPCCLNGLGPDKFAETAEAATSLAAMAGPVALAAAAAKQPPSCCPGDAEADADDA
uniref:SAM-dependent MTase TRM10-type domain-containing protein n=1 Tax=Macrostomum lignano TaxID=282301 RepID=A0A1I8F1M7_9PLAT